MKPDHWGLVEHLFESAIKLPPAVRTEFVEERCGSDVALLQELTSLLSWYSGAGAFFEAAVRGSMESLVETDPATDEFSGTDRFQLQRRIGEGGFGVVYQAYDRAEDLVVALKRLRDARGPGPALLKREFRILAGVDHPNLVKLYELFFEGGNWFFTMELVDGSHLTSFLRSRPRDYETIRNLFAQIAGGLLALHEAGIIHRDLKPANILVTPQGSVRICDFGLAVGTSTEPGDILRHAGTPVYMSPEQIRDLSLTPASDWYSLGIILFEALTGRLPFASEVPVMADEKRRLDGPAPSDVVGGIPIQLDLLCLSLLRREPAERPDGREVLRQLGTASRPEALTRARATAWIGRQHELKVLDDAFRVACGGETVSVCVAGASGAGKSALVKRFLQGIQQAESPLLFSGQCYELESMPYKALDDVMDGLAQYLHRESLDSAMQDLELPSRLFPVFGHVGELFPAPAAGTQEAKELRQVAASMLHKILYRLGSEKCLVLFIDDLHWGDIDSASLLADILTSGPSLPLLLIGTFRSPTEDAGPFLPTFFSGGGEPNSVVARRIRLNLEELSSVEAENLAADLLGGMATRESVSRIAEESRGNPFFIQQLVTHYQMFRSAAAGNSEALQLNGLIEHHLADLPAESRRLLEVIAIVGRPLEWQLARKAASQPLQRYTVLGMLRNQRMIRVRWTGQQSQVEIYHDRMREAISRLLPVDRRRELHHTVATVLEDSGGVGAEELAIHYHAAGASDKALPFSISAARQAYQVLAFDNAIRFYRMALDLDPSTANELRVDLADALASAGRGAEAAGIYLDSASGASGTDALELNRRAAAQLLTSGHMNEGIAVLSKLLASVGLRLPATPLGTIASLLLVRLWLRIRGLRFHERPASEIARLDLVRIDTCWAAIQGFGMVDTIRAAYFQALHMALALKSGENSRIVRAFVVDASHFAISGTRQHARADRALAKASRLAGQTVHPNNKALLALVSGMTAFLRGEWDGAHSSLVAAETTLREQCAGVAWELATCRLMGSVSLFFLGRLDELMERLPTLLARANARGDRFEATELRIRITHVILLVSDEPGRASLELKTALSCWPDQPFHLQHWWGLIAGLEIALYCGEGLRAWETITTVWPVLEGSFLLRVQYVLIESLHHRAASALAAIVEGGPLNPMRAILLRRAERDAALIENERTNWGDALALLVRASVSCSYCANPEQAVASLAEAESRLEVARMRLFAAAARHRRGILLGSREIMESATAWMAAQGIKDQDRMAAMLAPGEWTRFRK